MSPEVIIIGGGVVDIPLRPITESILSASSVPLDDIRMQAGGDAVNESIIISRLGHRAALISLFGDDAAGSYLTDLLSENGIDTSFIRKDPEKPTGINIVLIREDGERSFITNRKSTLRALSLGDILPLPPQLRGAKVACLASTFVSPALTVSDMARVMRACRAQGMITCADTTRPKNNETVKDLRELLPLIDYYFPNADEARVLTGCVDPDAIADAFLENGANTLVLKLGDQGCLVADRETRFIVPGFAADCIDTTGAGDNFAAGFITALLEERPLRECARFANAVASVCVEHIGATAGVTDRAAADARFNSDD